MLILGHPSAIDFPPHTDGRRRKYPELGRRAEHMTPERWERVQEIFTAALGRVPAERVVFLDEACRGDGDMRREVESLLASDETSSSGVLESPVIAGMRARAPAVGARKPLTRGARLGSFEIVGPLGSGGMGEVYERRIRVSGRDVAIKVLPMEVAADRERLEAIREGGPLGVRPEPPQHRDDLRDGILRRCSVDRDGARGRRDAPEATRGRSDFQTKKLLNVAVQIAEGLATSPRDRDRASGPEARERDGDEGRAGQDPGLRSGEAVGPDLRRERRRVAAADGDGDEPRDRAGDGRLHVAGAGLGQGGGLPVGPVRTRLDALRDGDGTAGVPEEDRRSTRCRRF